MKIRNIVLDKASPLYPVIDAKINNKTEPTPEHIIIDLSLVLLEMYRQQLAESEQGDEA